MSLKGHHSERTLFDGPLDNVVILRNEDLNATPNRL